MSCCYGRMMKCFMHSRQSYNVLQLGKPEIINNDKSSEPMTKTNNENPVNNSSSSASSNQRHASNLSTNIEDSNKDIGTEDQLEAEDRERRPGIPPQPRNLENNLDDVEIVKIPKDKKAQEHITKSIMRNEFLRYILDADRLKQCIDAMYPKTLTAKEYVIKEGEIGAHMYISIEGSYEVTKGGMIVHKFKEGVTFGELAILYNTKRFASVQALTNAKVWVLDRRVYQKIMLKSLMEETEANINFMRNVPIFKGVDDHLLAKVGNLFKKEFFQTGSVIVRQGDRGDKFYLIRVGNVLVTKRMGEKSLEETVGTLKKGDFFGELALLKEDCRQATVTAQAPGVECLTLDRKNFIEHFGTIDEIKNYKYATPISADPKQKKKTEYSHISLDDLDVIATLGVGGFGRVELVEVRHDKSLTFALKYLKKLDMVQQQQQEHAYNEKMIMAMCDSDFICKLYNTYRDAKYLYFLMEVCLGGDLWTLLQKQRHKCFDEKSSRFLSACVIEAFDYLHSKQIVYRDLKPENLLLDNNGYVKLVDFGFAKQLGARGRTYTFAGTPEYVAPEIILNRGHDKAVDYWALGIFIHELLVGKPPFRGGDHMKTYNLIIRGIDDIAMPEKLSKTAKLLIRKLCRSVPSDRLGCQKNGMDAVRTNRWYDKFEWELLRSRKMAAPFKPKIKNNSDTTHFDKFPEDNDVPPDENSGWDRDF